MNSEDQQVKRAFNPLNSVVWKILPQTFILVHLCAGRQDIFSWGSATQVLLLQPPIKVFFGVSKSDSLAQCLVCHLSCVPCFVSSLPSLLRFWLQKIQRKWTVILWEIHATRSSSWRSFLKDSAFFRKLLELNLKFTNPGNKDYFPSPQIKWK